MSQTVSVEAPVVCRILDKLRCPVSGQPLMLKEGRLETANGANGYALNERGIPLFAAHVLSDDARRQREHYDHIAAAYVANLDYPHTQVYSAYLDQVLLDQLPDGDLGAVAEICCGRGEAMRLLAGRYAQGVGIDISDQMLNAALVEAGVLGWVPVQGDATRLPLADNAFEAVIMLGGIHHINDRAALFCEIARILKPGGRFYWREPVSDFWLWRMLRAVIYRFSPILDHETERPLRHHETEPYLTRAGLTLETWRTVGYAGFCLFMNSDVLVFNRLFRFVPGIKAITRAFVACDDAISRLPRMGRSGLQVIGVAHKKSVA